MAGPTALITGITGQDGAYLAEFLLARGYAVHGLTRHSTHSEASRLVLTNDAGAHSRLTLHTGDLADAPSLLRLVGEVRPTEIYNLGAQSHVGVSFTVPEYTFDCNALGTLRLLEAVRSHGLCGQTRFYQASTSEMFGDAQSAPQDEATPFRPRSPYGVAKLAAHWQTVNYRAAYGLFACSGILFNHESPRRGTGFVSRKITQGLSRVALGLQPELVLGNLDAKRDWGHARDYVEAQWLMLQQTRPDDYVIATGEQHSVREFVEAAATELGLRLRWQGRGLDEVALIDEAVNSALPRDRIVVRVDARHLRPAEVPDLRGDASKARRELGWSPRTDFRALVREMVAHDLALARRELVAAAQAP